MALRRKSLFLCIALIFLLLDLYLVMDNFFSISYEVSYEEKETFVTRNISNIRPSHHVPPASGVWTIEPRGRLGNLMGEYATLYALSKINGHQAYILPYMYKKLSRLFKIKLPVLPKKVNERIKWKRYMLKNWMLPEYKTISGHYVQLLGTPYSWTFFHHLKDEILQEFTFQDYVKKRAYEYLDKVKGHRQNVTFIGVHVRRGDYVEIMPRERGGVVADKGYMDKAMAYFRDKYANPIFVVTSNGMDWCKENINNSLGDVHFAGNGNEGSPFRDFALLAHCNHTIMTIGSFGIWASYLTGGETIYLLNYTLPNSPYLQAFKYEAVYLPNWIGIPADLSPLMKQGKPVIYNK